VANLDTHIWQLPYWQPYSTDPAWTLARSWGCAYLQGEDVASRTIIWYVLRQVWRSGGKLTGGEIGVNVAIISARFEYALCNESQIQEITEGIDIL
jgi:hypothetical protein